MQNIADKTFGSAEINHKSISDDGNKNKCPHDIGILNDKVQSLEMENSFLENEIHDVTSLLNTITISQRTHYMKNLTVKKHLTNWVMLITVLII